MRETRMLRAMRRELETGQRPALFGHEGGNPGDSQGLAYGLPRQLSTLPHYWGRSRRGMWVVKRKTAKDRFSRVLKAINQWCWQNRHRTVPEQWGALCRKLRGLYAFYGISGNIPSLRSLRYEVLCLWWKWLGRRSQKGRMPWSRFQAILRAFPLPLPRVMGAT